MLTRRLSSSLLANIYSQAVGNIAQLVLVSAFLYFWSMEAYGTWIVLMTIPGYLTLGDLGIGTAVSNRVTMAVAQARPVEAAVCLQTAAKFYLILLIAGLFVAGAACLLVPASITLMPSETGVRLGNYKTLALLLVYVFANLQLGLAAAIYRSIQRNARGVFVGSHSKLWDFVITAAVLSLGGSPKTLLMALVGGRIVFFAAVLLDCRRLAPDLSLIGRGFSWGALRSLLPSGVGFMAFSVGWALILQGMTLMVNALLGAAAVVTFTTLRSLVRLMSQVMGLISVSIWPEFSTLFATGDLGRARRLHRIAVASSLYLSLMGFIGILGLGPQILAVWTHHQVTASRGLILIFALPVLFNTMWFTSSTVLVAINQHQRLAVRFVLGAGISLALAWVLVPLYGLAGAAMALLAMDLALIPYVWRASCALLQDDVRPFLLDIVSARSATEFFRERVWDRWSRPRVA